MAILETAGSREGGLRALSLMMGTFLFYMGIDKVAWLTDHEILAGLFEEWLRTAPPASRWYLETVAIPGTPVFARLVPVAELVAGAALVTGVWVRLTAIVTLVMVLNFHFASDVLFHYSYLINAYGLPIMIGLVALAIAGGRLPLSMFR